MRKLCGKSLLCIVPEGWRNKRKEFSFVSRMGREEKIRRKFFSCFCSVLGREPLLSDGLSRRVGLRLLSARGYLTILKSKEEKEREQRSERGHNHHLIFPNPTQFRWRRNRWNTHILNVDGIMMTI